MSILITGGAGLVGMALRQRLAQLGRPVVATDAVSHGRDDPDLIIAQLTDQAAVEALFANHDITAVIHCGAISGPMLARDNPGLVVDVNIAGTARLMDQARRHGVRRFVFCSSISVYGSVGPGVINEATPLRPTSVYAASKVSGEALVDAFLTEHGLDGVSLRIARVYGPHRRGNCVLADVIRNHLAGNGTVIPCDPNFMYHYVHVDDVVGAIITALDAGRLPERRYNVAGGEALTMPDIVATAQQALPGARIAMVAGQDDVPDIQREFDISAIARDLGWMPQMPLARGIALYAESLAQTTAAQ
ncbi:NAD-dependent epimerase/dehydratase family protein [Devosia faecipullorum]|uniref:NAD-dependent epimerase/dehydratase family protein n=1 Tax=Devosia faecipullorum TaxID=2755039 RepID=UPI00187B5D0A|nr:NAD(P)-dependent oxidoreductase [Devosia faecipullorum]MBE7734073.1 NAD(P)-dependent oxidoreductase [Devosia faecipullorum]